MIGGARLGWRREPAARRRRADPVCFGRLPAAPAGRPVLLARSPPRFRRPSPARCTETRSGEAPGCRYAPRPHSSTLRATSFRRGTSYRCFSCTEVISAVPGPRVSPGVRKGPPVRHPVSGRQPERRAAPARTADASASLAGSDEDRTKACQTAGAVVGSGLMGWPAATAARAAWVDLSAGVRIGSPQQTRADVHDRGARVELHLTAADASARSGTGTNHGGRR